MEGLDSMALFKVDKQSVPSNLLVDRFIVPPFSVLDTKQGYWQDRKRYWLSLGIKGELGRGESLLYNIGHWNYDDDIREQNIDIPEYKNTTKNGKKQPQMTWQRSKSLTSDDESAERYGRKAHQTSIFDPVLCEIAYKWFTNPGDKVLDPFAGGSVRGMIAGILGRNYTGIDLSEIQLIANREQYHDISEKYSGIIEPLWLHGDSSNVKELTHNDKFNFIFSCPPYYNLEVYSTNENDLSYKDTYQDFLESYEHIIKESCDLLENDSFAVFVVGNLRNDTDGGYYDFSGDTIRAFQKAGLIYYNDGIIVNVAGTLPVRAPGQFNNSRKLGKQHQNFLVFYKGNPKNIKNKLGLYEEEAE